MKVYNKAKRFVRQNSKKIVIFACIVLVIFLLGAVHWLDTPRGVCFRYFVDVFPLMAPSEVLYDTHGGFLGDGIRLTRFALGDKSAAFLDKACQAGWKELPLPDWLAQYGNDKYNLSSDVGTWQYRSTRNHLYSDGKPSNYVLAVIDAQDEVLYILEYDS